jgi:hypothetical protein
VSPAAPRGRSPSPGSRSHAGLPGGCCNGGWEVAQAGTGP